MMRTYPQNTVSRNCSFTMKTEKEIRDSISKVTADNFHILDCYPATTEVNVLRALMQVAATTKLSVLYDILGEKRPKFKCDNIDKLDY